jgi:hypothetical protein
MLIRISTESQPRFSITAARADVGGKPGKRFFIEAFRLRGAGLFVKRLAPGAHAEAAQGKEGELPAQKAGVVIGRKFRKPAFVSLAFTRFFIGMLRKENRMWFFTFFVPPIPWEVLKPLMTIRLFL